MNPVKLSAVFGVVALAFALFLSGASGAGTTVEAKDSTSPFTPLLVTETVEMRFQEREGRTTTTVEVLATKQSGSNEVVVRHLVKRCVEFVLPGQSLCLIHPHPIGGYTATLVFSLSEAKLTVRPNPNTLCDTTTCSGVRPYDIELRWAGYGGVDVDGDTKTRKAWADGNVEGVPVTAAPGTLSITRTRLRNY